MRNVKTQRMGKRLLSGALASLLVLGAGIAGAASVAAKEEAVGTVTFSVEKFTLGQGYIVEPVQVEFKEGDSVADLLDVVFGADNYKAPESPYGGYYLASVKDTEGGELHVPAYILEAVEAGGEAVEAGGVAEEGWLGEYDYTSQAGWMFMLNNTMAATGLWDTPAQDGDVIRLGFSLWGYGADFMDTGWGEPLSTFANLDAATVKLAAFNGAADRDEQLADPQIKAAYDALVAAVTDLTSAQSDVDSALTDFRAALGEPVEPAGTTTAAATAATTTATTAETTAAVTTTGSGAATTAADDIPATGEAGSALPAVLVLGAGAVVLAACTVRRRRA